MRPFVFLLIASLAVACSREPEDRAEPAAPRLVPEAAPPSGTLATVDLKEPGPFLEGARALFESPLLQSFVPDSAGGILRNVAGLPAAVARSVPAGAPIAGVAIESPAGWELVLATRVERAVEGAAPLGAGVQVRPGAPGGGLWVRDPEEGDAQPAVALVSELLFVAAREEAIERAHRHLAHRLASQGDATLRVRFQTAALARHVRPRLEDRARALAAEAHAAAERAREEAGRAPDLGDPDATIDAARGAALRLASHLPDLEEATFTAGFDGGLGRFELRARAKEGSPLAEALGGVEATGGLSALMRATPGAAALVVGLADAAGFSRALGALGAGELSDADRSRLDAAFPGSVASTLAFGGDGEGGFVRVSRAGGEPGDWPSELLAVSHVRVLLAALVGCEPPRRGPSLRGDAEVTFCALGDHLARAAIESSDDARALSLATRTRASEAAEGSRGELARDHADAARALAALSDEDAWALYLEGSRVIPSLALSAGYHDLRALSSALPPRPIVLSGGAKGREARARALVTRGAVDRFFALFGEARRILAGR